jgi:hypothetical protein
MIKSDDELLLQSHEYLNHFKGCEIVEKIIATLHPKAENIRFADS